MKNWKCNKESFKIECEKSVCASVSAICDGSKKSVQFKILKSTTITFQSTIQ